MPSASKCLQNDMRCVWRYSKRRYVPMWLSKWMTLDYRVPVSQFTENNTNSAT